MKNIFKILFSTILVWSFVSSSAITSQENLTNVMNKTFSQTGTATENSSFNYGFSKAEIKAESNFQSQSKIRSKFSLDLNFDSKDFPESKKLSFSGVKVDDFSVKSNFAFDVFGDLESGEFIFELTDYSIDISGDQNMKKTIEGLSQMIALYSERAYRINLKELGMSSLELEKLKKMPEKNLFNSGIFDIKENSGVFRLELKNKLDEQTIKNLKDLEIPGIEVFIANYSKIISNLSLSITIATDSIAISSINADIEFDFQKYFDNYADYKKLKGNYSVSMNYKDVEVSKKDFKWEEININKITEIQKLFPKYEYQDSFIDEDTESALDDSKMTCKDSALVNEIKSSENTWYQSHALELAEKCVISSYNPSSNITYGELEVLLETSGYSVGDMLKNFDKSRKVNKLKGLEIIIFAVNPSIEIPRSFALENSIIDNNYNLEKAISKDIEMSELYKILNTTIKANKAKYQQEKIEVESI